MARPRSFDIEKATDQALELFWAKGYEGTTLEDLTAALGINRPSLYAAFGNKEGLFRRALDRYTAGSLLQPALAEPTARAVAETLLRTYADAAARTSGPKGCLLVQGALACGESNTPIRDMLAERRNLAEAALVERFERARKEGDLKSTEKPKDLARFVWSVCHGLVVETLGGATREELRRVVQLAMRAWPS